MSAPKNNPVAEKGPAYVSVVNLFMSCSMVHSFILRIICHEVVLVISAEEIVRKLGGWRTLVCGHESLLLHPPSLLVLGQRHSVCCCYPSGVEVGK
jgi:hypothetical protein